MSDYKSNTQLKFSSEKSFGLLFSIVFLLISLYPLLQGSKINFVFLVIAFIFLFLSFTFPLVFKYPNIIWINIGILLGKVVSPIVMGIIYIGVFFPFGIIMKLFKHDPLDSKYSKSDKTYWKIRKDKIYSMKRMY